MSVVVGHRLCGLEPDDEEAELAIQTRPTFRGFTQHNNIACTIESAGDALNRNSDIRSLCMPIATYILLQVLLRNRVGGKQGGWGG